MEKVCRQLTYHLSPHSQWRRQGLLKRKPQAWWVPVCVTDAVCVSVFASISVCHQCVIICCPFGCHGKIHRCLSLAVGDEISRVTFTVSVCLLVSWFSTFVTAVLPKMKYLSLKTQWKNLISYYLFMWLAFSPVSTAICRKLILKVCSQIKMEIRTGLEIYIFIWQSFTICKSAMKSKYEQLIHLLLRLSSSTDS